MSEYPQEAGRPPVPPAPPTGVGCWCRARAEMDHAWAGHVAPDEVEEFGDPDACDLLVALPGPSWPFWSIVEPSCWGLFIVVTLGAHLPGCPR